MRYYQIDCSRATSVARFAPLIGYQRRLYKRRYPQHLRGLIRGGRTIGGGTTRGPQGRHLRRKGRANGSTNARPKPRAINTKNTATVDLLYPYLTAA